jgi:hypothetical protein
MPYLRDFSLLFWYNESIKIKAVFPMMTQNADKKREQIQMFCMDDLVPQDHLLRLIDQAIDWSFIYDLVIDKYSADNGRPSMDPVMLIKIPFIQYLYGRSGVIPSSRSNFAIAGVLYPASATSV